MTVASLHAVSIARLQRATPDECVRGYVFQLFRLVPCGRLVITLSFIDDIIRITLSCSTRYRPLLS